MSLTPFSSTCVDVANGMLGYVMPRFWAGRSPGEETRLSRSTHSVMRAWTPADNWVARDNRYDHMSALSFQKGSEASAARRAGRMCGSGGRARVVGGCSPSGVLAGVAIEAVERSEAAMVSRICDSVLRVEVTTHAVLCQYSGHFIPRVAGRTNLDSRCLCTTRPPL